MTKQQITIEVPDGREVVGFRYAWESATELCVVAQIADAWQFPTWTSATWLAMDKDGVWSFFQNEPQISDDYWWAEGYSLEVNSLLDFTPPPVSDWRQSKRRRPGS